MSDDGGMICVKYRLSQAVFGNINKVCGSLSYTALLCCRAIPPRSAVVHQVLKARRIPHIDLLRHSVAFAVGEGWVKVLVFFCARPVQ